jgi:formate dehydrogenase major subunit
VPGGGVNALRGHSNVQGITDVGTLTAAIPGYLALPTESEPTLESHLGKRTFKPLQPDQTSYWQNYRKFYVSFLKTYFGDKATPENEFGYQWLPKLDVAYDALRMFEVMHQGKTTGLLCQGFNPLMSIAYKNKNIAALAKLKFLVSMDPIETDTVRFWENHGEFNNVDTAKIQTEVFMLPVTTFVEEDGSFTNSSRCIQWKWRAADSYFESRKDSQPLRRFWRGGRLSGLVAFLRGIRRIFASISVSAFHETANLARNRPAVSAQRGADSRFRENWGGDWRETVCLVPSPSRPEPDKN